MGHQDPPQPPGGERVVLQEKARPAAAPRASVVFLRGTIQVLGELLITAGIVLLLFVAWQLWWTNVESDAKQSEAVKDFAQEFQGPLAPPSAPAATSPVDYGPPTVAQAPAHGATIGIIYIPRFGETYTRPIVQGTSTDVL